MTSLTGVCLLVCLCFTYIVCPPVKEKPVVEEKNEDDGVNQLLYSRYLQEVIGILEKDPEFRKKLEDTNATHIKTHEFAMELDFVNHQVREQLDEAKRAEIKRLKDLYRKKNDIMKGQSQDGHLDSTNADTFEIDDLKKLIQKTTQDLDDIDKKRRDEFKTYEMDKEHKRQEAMEGMDDEHKKLAQKEHDENMTKHKDHPKLHHPGSKAQLEDVWEKEDHLDREDFNPKTFFEQRDLNGDGMWTPDEVESLFQLELDKLYESNHTEDDMNERFEEMQRMREHLVKEVDHNKDGVITKEEFGQYSKSSEFDNDEPWDDIADQPNYTDEEFTEYEKMLEDGKKNMEHYEGEAQPGEIHVPPAQDEKVQEMAKDGVTP